MTKKTAVAIASHAMTVPSTWSKAYLLGRELELTVVIPEKWGTAAEPGGDENSTPGCFIRLPCRLHGHNHLFSYKGLERIFKTKSYDLFHIDEEAHSLVSFQIARTLKRRSIPYVIFVWQNILKKYPTPWRQMEAFVFRNAAGVICGNEDAEQIVRRKGFSGPTSVIPQFGVDLIDLPPRSYQNTGKSLNICYVGRLVEEKGIDTLLYALKKIPEACLGIVGAGPYKDRLQDLTRRLQITSRVQFRGELPSNKIRYEMRRYDVLVLPSLTCANWKEQFGRVLIEAMSVETVVVGSSSGEIPIVIGDSGLVFSEGDPVDLESKLRKLFSVKIRRQFAAKGRSRVGLHFSQNIVVDKSIQFYNQVLGR